MINPTVYYVLVALLALGVLLGIYLMSKVKTSVIGNAFSGLCMVIAIVLTLVQYKIFDVWVLYPCMAIGGVIGIVWAYKVKMIQMPQLVALFNGVGGLASALVAMVTMLGITIDGNINAFVMVTASLALAVGMITFVGSFIAAGKLHKILPQKAVVIKGHQPLMIAFMLVTIVAIVLSGFYATVPSYVSLVLCLVASIVFGCLFAIRVGGADMPVVISLLNSLSGVAAGIAGMAIGDYLLVAIGGIVGASGLLLTQIMCKAMNRKLVNILFGISPKAQPKPQVQPQQKTEPVAEDVKVEEVVEKKVRDVDILNNAKEVIIVPGYGMALAQAQHTVKQLADKLVAKGTIVKYAIHPVAGRMPGHMNVLLCEADVDYEDLYQMEDINDEFEKADAVVVVGANDVLNPAAREAEGTPIYGMPVLNVDKAKYVIICNYDLKPGYAGVENPLYTREEGVSLRLGNAAETVQQIIIDMDKPAEEVVEEPVVEEVNVPTKKNEVDVLKEAKEVIIVPGYGMALAQAQHIVKQLADTLTSRGTTVKYAIHPVAGRMPGHMNVLLCEADVDYEDLYQMEDINDEFEKADAVVVVGANDVLNPAAREAEGTPIYGMPVLNVDKAKYVIICNYDLKPGYAGVENPLYKDESKVTLLLGDASKTVADLVARLNQ